MNTWYRVIEKDCLEYLNGDADSKIHLSFIDPPFNQGKDYRHFNDNMPDEQYWNWIESVLGKIYERTADGGSIYFMQREKNAEQVLRVIRASRWVYQNFIIWRKKTSAVPSDFRFSKQYQIIVFATKTEKPRVFNKLRIDLPIPPGYKYERDNGVYISDVWDDIRELTSGYFAGDEALRDSQGNRFHNQQSPVTLLLRIILTSSMPDDIVFDPFAGTGTTLVVANQLGRNSIGTEIDPENVRIIEERMKYPRVADNISKHYEYYKYTPDLEQIWPEHTITLTSASEQMRFL